MLLEKEREAIVAYGKKLVESGLIRGTGGNLSLRNPETGYFAISPSGLAYEALTPDDVVVLDLGGNLVDGNRKPSSEVEMHRIFYQNRENVHAVVHTHSTFCTVLASLRWELPPSSYLVAFAGERVRCAPYASYGTRELAENCYRTIGDDQAVLLANHGLTAVGATLPEAFNIADMIEGCAEVYVRAKGIGEPVLLSSDEMQKMIRSFREDYGQK